MQQFFSSDISINFNLRQSKRNKPTIIYCVVCFNGKQHKYNTLVKVLPKQWNAKKQLAIVSPTLSPQDNRNNIICNDRLSLIRKEVEQKLLSFTNYYNFASDIINLINPHQPSLAMAKKQNKSKESTQPQASVSTTATDILYTMLKDDTKIGVNSLTKTYRVYINLLEQFFAKKRIKNELKSLNYDVLCEYAEYLQATQTSSYAKRVFNLLRSWLKKRLTKHGVGYEFDTQIDTIPLETTTISASERGDDYIALTHDQIYLLYNLTDEQLLNSTLKLEDLRFYRDMFVMQCFCGCRASDIVKLFDANNLNENSQGVPFLEFWSKKTENNENADKCVVPLTLYPEQLILLEKYKDVKMYETYFTGDSDNSYNKHIKEICRIASFNKLVERTVEVKGGKKKKEKKTLYERVTSHVARHSFITNCVREFHLTPNEIKYIVGHADTQYIDKVYLNLTTTDKADKITRKLKQKDNTATVVPQQQPQLKDGDPADIVEAIAVLHMLNANPDDYIGVTDFKALIRQVSKRENEIKNIFGGGRYEFKPIFNENELPSNRRIALKELLKALEQQNEV